ncbi:MAG: two-component system histidine kinase PnpS [Thermodesulfobacteriota bacterium]
MKPRLSFKSAIFIPCLLVMLCTLAFVATFLRRALEDQVIVQGREVLLQQTALLGEIIPGRWPANPTPTETDALADYLSAKSKYRVTIISPQGEIMGDSQLEVTDLSKAGNQSWQPEIIQTMRHNRGWSLRTEDAAGEMIFAAELFKPDGRTEIILRLAMPLDALADKMGRVKRLILWASLLGGMIALGVAFLAAYHVAVPLRELTQAALNISSGDLSQRLRWYPKNEIGDLARAFDRMADHLQEEIEAVTGARDRLETILRSMAEGVLVTDRSGRITLANQALSRLLGLDSDPVGRLTSEIIRKADLIEAVQSVAEGYPRAKLEIRTLGPRPRILQVEVSALPADTSRSGVVVVFHDITEFKRLEEMRRDFVANVSHELRTPLAAVKGAVETLLDGALDNPKFARRFTEVIERHVKRLEGIVLDLLELARLEKQDLVSQKESLSVETLARSCLAAVEELASERRVTLENELPADPLLVQGDQRQLEQALVNLLENAVKYTNSGGRVTLSAYKLEGMIHLKVSDTGIGIAPEHLPRIFERFYRVDKNRSREMGGTGLGLAIVKHVALAHGGRVEVESRLGRGSTFSLTLPGAENAET